MSKLPRLPPIQKSYWPRGILAEMCRPIEPWRSEMMRDTAEEFEAAAKPRAKRPKYLSKSSSQLTHLSRKDWRL